MPRNAGMTLVELVIVIVIAGIIATITTSFIVTAVTGYSDLERRGQLVDAAESSLRHLARDVRRALPNSVRVASSLGANSSVVCNAAGSYCAIEMLNTLDGARYREGPGQVPGGHPHGNLEYRLTVGATDANGFNIVGLFQNLAVPFSSTTEHVAIYNQGITGADAYYDGDESVIPAPVSYVMTRPDVTNFRVQDDGGGDEHQIVPGKGSFNFAYASPSQRVYVVDTPVTYLCSPGANGTITRYWNYAINTSQPVDPALAPLAAVGVSSQLLTTPVTACSFNYQPGTDQRGGTITLDITVGDTASEERVRLLYQVHVDNAP